MQDEYEIDIFRALGHTLRRRILRLIAERGSVSYKELSRLEPKPGVLYHHLRLLGDLIYQDENRQYKLTEKGRRAYEFLVTMFVEPEDKSIHKFLTPRWLLERLEGKIVFVIFVVFIITSFLWSLSDGVSILLVIVPNYQTHYIPKIFLPILNWLLSSIVISGLLKLSIGRNVRVHDIASKNILSFIIINLYPVIELVVISPLLRLLLLFLIQLFVLLLFISSVSVVAGISLRNSGLIVVALHYLSILIALALVHF
ncbi:MAG: winged helix-turn-helix domain-containing protein [Candidatus Njordarchaeota archaeon]